mgnify:CR=1 FL=1
MATTYNKGGRPKKEEKQNKIVRLYFTEAEYSKIEEQADKAKLRTSQLLRDMSLAVTVNGSFVIKMPSEINQELLSEFNALANNFNQIAFNSKQFGVNPALAKLIVESLETMQKKMKEILQQKNVVSLYHSLVF